MSLSEIRTVLRRMFGVTPTLDLHGLGVKEALRETEAYIVEAREALCPSVRIAYGKGKRSVGGRGVLREVIPRWLNNEGRPLIRRWERQLDESGAEGAAIVWVRLDDLEEEIDEELDKLF